MAKRSHILSGLAAEVAFAVLPLLVVWMVLAYTNHGAHLFTSPEWSFGAAILFGQAIVKFVAGLARAGQAAPGPVAFVLTLVVVFGLVPSLLVLTMTLHSSEMNSPLSKWLQVFQVLWFIGASLTYMTLGTIGEQWGDSNTKT